MLGLCHDVTWVDPPPPVPRWRALAGRLVRPLRSRLRPAQPAQAPSQSMLIDTLARRVLDEDFDLVWLGFGGISYPLLELKARTGRPIVLETESIWSQFIAREAPFATDRRRRAEIEHERAAKVEEERAGAAIADLTTAVSEVDAAYFRGLVADPARVMLLANVIDVDAYAHATQSPRLKTPAICFAATMALGTANVDAALWLLDVVMPRVWAQSPELHLYLVGRHPAPPLRARRGRRVHVTGEVASIVPYFRQSLAAVVPLRWESGTRFKILEAFACHTPVVSTTLGAEGLAVESGRDLLLADEPDAFADAILSLIRDPKRGTELAAPAYDLVRSRYDLSTAERQIEAILERVLPG
jgi:glycosyltransferase involved in cell wall biosynthesis